MAGVRVRVPGKVMLGGEYSVLWGGRSLAFTLSSSVVIDAELLPEGRIELHSDLWVDPCFTSVLELDSAAWGATTAPLLLQAARRALHCYDLPGIRIKASTEFSVKAGFGSSSALALGVMLAALVLSRGADPLTELTGPLGLQAARHAFALQREIQGFASGYDVATQWCGGVVVFAQDERSWPRRLEKFDLDHERLTSLVRIFTNDRGAPTARVGGGTLGWLEQGWGRAAVIEVGEQLVGGWLTILGAETASNENSLRAALYAACAAHRLLFADAPSYPRALLDELACLPGFATRWTGKPSGAGGEDAFLLIGPASHEISLATQVLHRFGWQEQPYGLSAQGAALMEVTS